MGKSGINKWFEKENARLQKEALKRLADANLTVGKIVMRKHDSVYFRITAFHFAGITPYGGYISLHGVRHTHKGWGGHIHFIGFPGDVAP